MRKSSHKITEEEKKELEKMPLQPDNENIPLDALVSPARHNLMGILPLYLMAMKNFRMTDMGLLGGKRIETYGSKKVGIWAPDTWKEKCKTQPKQGRNEQCNCGSGKKYKHCCALSG
jgi:hypothetical protein